VGGALALIGLLAITGAIAINMVVWQMAQPGADDAQMAALLERVQDTAGIWIPFLVLTFAFGVGLLVLAGGLALARVVSPITAACLAIGGVLVAIAYPLASEWLVIAAAALLVVGSGSAGLMIVRETDADWEHTPEFRGFRPAAGTS
jgi:hypothetical protein